MSAEYFNNADWTEIANADNALATATKAAVVGESHYVVGIAGSYTVTDDGMLTLKDGSTEIFKVHIYNSFSIMFPFPINITIGAACSVELAASGTPSTFGHVSLVGLTSARTQERG